MSPRERQTPVPLDGLSEDRLARLREETGESLVSKAEDLRLLRGEDDQGQAIREVAALGRLARGLGRGEILVPDRAVMELVARRTTETIHLEEVREEYEQELAGHEAWVALLTHLARGRRAGSQGSEATGDDAEG